MESSLVSINIVSTQPVAKAACSKQRLEYSAPTAPQKSRYPSEVSTQAKLRGTVSRRLSILRVSNEQDLALAVQPENIRTRPVRKRIQRFKGERSHIPERIATVSSTTTRESCFVSFALAVCTIFPELLDRGEEFVQHALPCYRLLNVVT
jgi:hypothetical protein